VAALQNQGRSAGYRDISIPPTLFSIFWSALKDLYRHQV
jgi:hypothetical protein